WRLSDAELRERFVVREREIVRLQAQSAADLAELDARRGFEPAFLDAASFVRRELSVSGSEAQRRVAEARGLVDHPVVAAAFSEGRIDRPRVGMLLASARVSAELFRRDAGMLVDQVAGLSMADATKAVEFWRAAADRESFARDAAHLHRRRRLHLSKTFGGMVRLDGELDPEGGELVITALRSLTEPTNLDPEDTRTQAQRRADALIDLCADHLDHGQVPVIGGRRPHLTLIVAAESLEADTAPGQLESGSLITPEAARRIACDAAVTEVTNNGGSTLDVGRTTRTIPPAIRTALIQRDGGCTHPGCDRPHRWCDAHHITHWAHGGPTSIDNLRLLCRRHHRMAHEGERRRR
ncbi:MAG TPA: DUF222 domain-containing protein, partial [Acidimicrobiia bacterium]|nr:DUF222 domain-containing protein [Acidimicrobiia bacterium]